MEMALMNFLLDLLLPPSDRFKPVYYFVAKKGRKKTKKSKQKVHRYLDGDGLNELLVGSPLASVIQVQS